MDEYSDISECVYKNNYFELNKILKNNNNLNVMYKNGKFFNIAIKNNNYSIVDELIIYFKKYQLMKCKNEYERLLLEQKMMDIIETATEDNCVGDEMDFVLQDYERNVDYVNNRH